MATTNGSITGRTAGDDWEVLLAVPDLPAGVSVAQAWLAIGGAYGTAFSSLPIGLHITTAAGNPSGQITDNGASSGIGQCNFLLSGSLTAGLTPGTSYHAELVVELSTGAVDTPWSGVAIADPPVTPRVALPGR